MNGDILCDAFALVLLQHEEDESITHKYYHKSFSLQMLVGIKTTLIHQTLLSITLLVSDDTVVCPSLSISSFMILPLFHSHV